MNSLAPDLQAAVRYAASLLRQGFGKPEIIVYTQRRFPETDSNELMANLFPIAFGKKPEPVTQESKTRRLVEHCGHCPEDYAKWVKRFPEDDDVSYQARLEKAADVGMEGMEDEELTPLGLARKRIVFLEIGGDM